MEMKDIQAKLDELKTSLTKAVTDEAKAEIKKSIDALEAKMPKTENIEKDVKDIKDWQVKKDEADKKNQEALDKIIAGQNDLKAGKRPSSFKEAFASAVEKNYDGIKKIEKERGSVIIEVKDFDVKTVGDMTLSNLSGDQQATYVGQGLIPADTINFRDLIPTRQTATGLSVIYREAAGEGTVGRQTEGSSKAQVDSDFTEVKVVQRYIAAFQRVSKQMLQDLPFLQGTLPRILMRKYMQKENLLLYADMSSSTNSTANSPSGGNTVEKILNMIKTQRDNNFSASFVLITWADWYNILVSARPSTGVDYSTPGGVVVTPTGEIVVAGVRCVPASWVTASDIQVIDTAYVERVEVDSLKVEFSTEDSDNFTKNLVTSRIECRTDLNVLLKAAHLNYGTAS